MKGKGCDGGEGRGNVRRNSGGRDSTLTYRAQNVSRTLDARPIFHIARRRLQIEGWNSINRVALSWTISL